MPLGRSTNVLLVQQDPRPYNPLDRVELGKSVERALLAQSLVALPPPSKFLGAGLYAIYYYGDLGCYSPISLSQRFEGEIPIYVGRARPRGARQGGLGLEATTAEDDLYRRLREHASSIRTVERHDLASGTAPTLRLEDFACRYLVADDIWVPLGETLLIAHYRPVWNVVVDGFGNHAPGGGRGKQARSSWDTLHPGRKWADKLPANQRSAEDIRRLVREHLRTISLPDLDSTPALDDQVKEALEADPDR